jgi:hypothetical protein
MYSSGPELTETIDLYALGAWLETVDPNKIASFGIYGGEPSIETRGFGRCLILARKAIGPKPCFVITNGSWSTDPKKTEDFLFFCGQHHLHVVISGTPEHRKFQDRPALEQVVSTQPDAFRLKPLEENFHAMGRLEGKMKFSCSTKCMSWKRAVRIAVQPDGTIIYQNCDGVYPVVGNLKEDFNLIDERIQAMRSIGFDSVCPHFKKLEVAT